MYFLQKHRQTVSARDTSKRRCPFASGWNFLYCVCVSSVFLFGPVLPLLGSWSPRPRLPTPTPHSDYRAHVPCPRSPPADQSSACLHLVEISVCTEMNTICLTSRCWKYTVHHARVGCLFVCLALRPVGPCPPFLSPICSALSCHTRRMGNVFQIVAVSLRDIWSELLCFVSVSMLAAVSVGCSVLQFYKHHEHFAICVVQFV